MQSENVEPTLTDVLGAIQQVSHRLDTLDNRLDTLDERLGTLEVEMKAAQTDSARNNERLAAEVKRWDDRFFKFAEDSANRANTLIAGGTISVITGVIFLLLKQS